MYLIGYGVRYSLGLFQFLLLIPEAGITEHIENSEFFVFCTATQFVVLNMAMLRMLRTIPLRVDILVWKG